MIPTHEKNGQTRTYRQLRQCSFSRGETGHFLLTTKKWRLVDDNLSHTLGFLVVDNI